MTTDRTDAVLDAIDGATRDWATSRDAMRWRGEQSTAPLLGRPRGPVEIYHVGPDGTRTQIVGRLVDEHTPLRVDTGAAPAAPAAPVGLPDHLQPQRRFVEPDFDCCFPVPIGQASAVVRGVSWSSGPWPTWHAGRPTTLRLSPERRRQRRRRGPDRLPIDGAEYRRRRSGR